MSEAGVRQSCDMHSLIEYTYAKEVLVGMSLSVFALEEALPPMSDVDMIPLAVSTPTG